MKIIPDTYRVRCEKVGPMQWLIHAPGKAPINYWVYALVVGGVSYTDTFEADLPMTETP